MSAGVAVPRTRSVSARLLSTLISAVVFGVLYGLLIANSPIEATTYSVTNFFTLAAPLAIAAIGTSLVLIVGGFDLSVAGTISLTNVLAATVMDKHPNQVWFIVIALVLLGALIGAINGALVALLQLPSLGVTLSTNIVLGGIALAVLPAPGGSVPLNFATDLTTSMGPLPVALLVLIVLGLLWTYFSRTRTGMAVYAVGGDAHGAQLSGISVTRTTITVFTIAGALYGLAGVFFSALTATGSPSSGSSFLLTAFAAAALGLVGFRGGAGSPIAAMLGAATLTIIPKFLFASGVADFWVGAFQGLIVLAALSIPLLTALASRRRARHQSGHDAGDPPPALVTSSQSAKGGAA